MAGPATDRADTLAELEHTNQLLTARLAEANDLVLDLCDLLQVPRDLTDIEGLTRLAPQIRQISRSAAIGLQLPNGSVQIDSIGPDHNLIDRALRGSFGDGLHRASKTGLPYDLLVRLAPSDSTYTCVFVSPENRPIGTAFVKLTDALIDALDSSLHLSMLHEREVERTLIERDARAAAELAALSLPAGVPSLPGLDVAARWKPAWVTGGDLLVWHQVGDDLVFAVGDVAGKGLTASVVMTMVCEGIRSLVQRNPFLPPDQLLIELAREQWDYLDRIGLFVTLAIGRWSAVRRTVTIANAGHSPVFARFPTGTQTIEASCPPLGVIPTITPVAATLILQPDDVVVIGSDGLAEQEDGDGDAFGEGRLRALVASSPGATAADMADRLFAAVSAHGGTKASDDKTLLMLRRTADEGGTDVR